MLMTKVQYSPRMWRWSQIAKDGPYSHFVFSTYVEVIPKLSQDLAIYQSILHVCGGDPWCRWCGCLFWRYSPRMWRWSWCIQTNHLNHSVFSTYVEVILTYGKGSFGLNRILHVCGGDPIDLGTINVIPEYSPRMWRWSWSNETRHLKTFVFSTYVEVILVFIKSTNSSGSILHVCGGDPVSITILDLW